MDVQATYTFDAPAAAVWDLLVDTEAIAACLPGCESLEPIGDNKFKAVLTMGVAAVTGRYEGTVEMADLDPPNSYRLIVEGRGKPGFVNGGGTITLAESDGSTVISVHGSVQVAGTIARVGQRLLGGVSKMTMDRFFNCLQTRLASAS
jgi:carbon monoxide dehydrogenase subunit G